MAGTSLSVQTPMRSSTSSRVKTFDPPICTEAPAKCRSFFLANHRVFIKRLAPPAPCFNQIALRLAAVATAQITSAKRSLTIPPSCGCGKSRLPNRMLQPSASLSTGGDLFFMGGEGRQNFVLLALRDLCKVQGPSEFRCDLIEFCGGNFEVSMGLLKAERRLAHQKQESGGLTAMLPNTEVVCSPLLLVCELHRRRRRRVLACFALRWPFEFLSVVNFAQPGWFARRRLAPSPTGPSAKSQVRTERRSSAPASTGRLPCPAIQQIITTC